MSTVEASVDSLEQAMRQLFILLKRPQQWERTAKEAGVSVDRPGFQLLATVHSQPGNACKASVAAQLLGIEAPSITRKSQELEKNGFLERLPDAEDKRAVLLRATTAGRRELSRMRNAQKKRLQAALASWKPREREQFILLFEAFVQNLSKEGGDLG